MAIHAFPPGRITLDATGKYVLPGVIDAHTPVSYTHLVERDVTEPSITSLRKIAKALDVPIFYFLLDTEEYSPVVRSENRKVLKFPQSHLTFELLTPDLSLSLIHIFPSTKLRD